MLLNEMKKTARLQIYWQGAYVIRAFNVSGRHEALEIITADKKSSLTAKMNHSYELFDSTNIGAAVGYNEKQIRKMIKGL